MPNATKGLDINLKSKSPKRWMIERDGQSVTYFRHNAKWSFLQAVFKQLEGR